MMIELKACLKKETYRLHRFYAVRRATNPTICISPLRVSILRISNDP